MSSAATIHYDALTHASAAMAALLHDEWSTLLKTSADILKKPPLVLQLGPF